MLLEILFSTNAQVGNLFQRVISLEVSGTCTCIALKILERVEANFVILQSRALRSGKAKWLAHINMNYYWRACTRSQCPDSQSTVLFNLI